MENHIKEHRLEKAAMLLNTEKIIIRLSTF